jgi:RNA polymerase sigma-70 factor (ECF subfamily)
MAMLKRLDPESLDEPALVALARTGDGDAFRVLMQRGNQRLFRVARGVVPDDAEAEDVLQESWVRAFAALDSFRGESGIMTWLTRIVLNEAKGRLRRRPTVDLDYLDRLQDGVTVITFPTSPVSEDPEGEAARAGIRRLLEQAVDDLPEAFRMVFILRDIEGCSIEETAADLDLNPATVKTRLHRARNLLREALDAKLSGVLVGAFPFLGARCGRITERVIFRLGCEGLLVDSHQPASREPSPLPAIQ